jgi:hypothetical protein
MAGRVRRAPIVDSALHMIIMIYDSPSLRIGPSWTHPTDCGLGKERKEDLFLVPIDALGGMVSGPRTVVLRRPPENFGRRRKAEVGRNSPGANRQTLTQRIGDDP